MYHVCVCVCVSCVCVHAHEHTRIQASRVDVAMAAIPPGGQARSLSKVLFPEGVGSLIESVLTFSCRMIPV